LQALRVPDSAQTIKARQVLTQLIELRQVAADLQVEIVASQKSGGVKLELRARVQKALQHADELGGLRELPDVSALASLGEKLTNEQEWMENIRADVLLRGAWTNSKASLGNYADYQQPDSIDFKAIEQLLAQTPSDPISSEARLWFAVINALVTIRRSVQSALKQGAHPSAWAPVLALLDEMAPTESDLKVREGLSALDRDRAIALSAMLEIQVARREAEYQAKVANFLSTLEDALKSKEDLLLVRLLRRARKLNCQPQYYDLVRLRFC